MPLSTNISQAVALPPVWRLGVSGGSQAPLPGGSCACVSCQAHLTPRLRPRGAIDTTWDRSSLELSAAGRGTESHSPSTPGCVASSQWADLRFISAWPSPGDFKPAEVLTRTWRCLLHLGNLSLRHLSHQFLGSHSICLDHAHRLSMAWIPPSSAKCCLASYTVCVHMSSQEMLGGPLVDTERRKPYFSFRTPYLHPDPFSLLSSTRFFSVQKNGPFASGKALTFFPQHLLFHPSNTKFALGFAFSDSLGMKAQGLSVSFCFISDMSGLFCS